MDKAWVWLPRASVEYEEGARAFVYASAKRLGNPLQLFCPCIDCRNVCHEDINTVVDHLVIRGMDQKYKRKSCWSIHGETRNEKTVDDQHAELEAYELFRPGHPYRRRKIWFDNTIEEGTANRVQTGAEIFELLRDFKNEFGKPLEKKKKRKRSDIGEGEELTHEEYEEDADQWRWKKRSILFELAYWKDMPVRHNIDIMHVEKNVSDAILSLLMHNAKSKDGLKARQDLEDIGIRKNLHAEQRGKKTYLPPAAYWLSKEEKKIFCKRLSEFRGPDGYCANIANYVSLDPPLIGGLKSHDHHVLLQNLLPVALRGLLPKGPRTVVTRLCNFFSRLCQRVIDPEKLITLEFELVETMCQMERYMKTLKSYVKNYARPEACMAEGYLAAECIGFCLEFLQSSVPVLESANRNEDVDLDENILEGRPILKAKEVTLSDKERDIAHRYIPTNSKEHSAKLRWLAFGPRHNVESYKGYIINGHRFHTEDLKRKTQNSGVAYEAFTMCRSTAKDTNQVADVVSYFGVIQEIILLDYHMFQVPLFKCKWANKGNGLKEEDGFTLVNFSLNQAAFLQDPFIMPSQAKQVFYSRETDSSPWFVVMRAPPRGYHELETEEEFVAAPISIEDNEDLGNESSDDESFCVRNDCEGVQSDRFRELRRSQIPHTTSRKGMVRLTHEMKKKSSDPSKVTRSKVWVVGNTHSDGRPVRPEFEETIEKIKSIDSEMESTASMSVKEDAVSQVLGKDKPGRIRGMGRGITATKIAFMQARDSHVQKLEAKQAELHDVVRGLQDVVRGLAASKTKPHDGVSNSEVSDISKGGPRCQILDWCSPDDVIIGEGEFCSAEQNYKIGRIPLGRNAGAILVKSVIDAEASVWRPTTTVTTLGQAVGTKIAWQLDKLILDNDLNSPPNKTAASSAADAEDYDPWPIHNSQNANIEAIKDKTSSKSRSPGSVSNSSNNSKNEKKKCILLDCNGSGKKVAEGRVLSSNPEDRVHHVPLGLNASKVWVDVPTIDEAPVWRANSEIKIIADALGSIIAWPNDKLVYI
ncbi:unnamed protein product [Arabidopsis arenosa]|uniref:Transposase-associated domain-containing protein n=1 Tax=Arabidopsis arenosa TaxID=38785 RepID=A0A8S2B343_ARAAE|nr:unnamed protein product [Arabidopsis arenosa]